MLPALPDGKHGGEEKRELQLCFLTGKKPGGSVSAPALLLPGCGVRKGETEWGQGVIPRVAGAGTECGAGSISSRFPCASSPVVTNLT